MADAAGRNTSSSTRATAACATALSPSASITSIADSSAARTSSGYTSLETRAAVSTARHSGTSIMKSMLAPRLDSR